MYFSKVGFGSAELAEFWIRKTRVDGKIIAWAWACREDIARPFVAAPNARAVVYFLPFLLSAVTLPLQRWKCVYASCTTRSKRTADDFEYDAQ